jgi:hypothetical protein
MWPLEFFNTVIHIFIKVLGDAPFACQPATHNTFGKPLNFQFLKFYFMKLYFLKKMALLFSAKQNFFEETL